MNPATGSALDRLIDGLGDRGEQPLLLHFQANHLAQHSYRDVGEQVQTLACGLRRRVEPGEAVALFGPEGAEWIIAALAILRSGAMVTPLDAQFADDTLQHVLRDSGARHVFTTTEQRGRIQAAAPHIEPILLDGAADDPQSWRALTCDDALPDNRADDPAALFYTSGTTGPPKGVPLSHRNLGFQLDTLAAAGVVQAGDRVLLPLPLHHVYPFVIGLLAPLSLGLTLVIPQALTGPQLIRAVRDGGVSVIIGVPRLYAALFEGIAARAARAGRLAETLFRGLLGVSRAARRHLGLHLGKALLYPLHRQMGPQLRVLACGGAALHEELAWNLEALGWQVAVGYGLTETAPLLAIDPPGRARPGSVGRPVPGVELRIDREAAAQQGLGGATGEIQARGPNVFAGYRNQPQQSRAAFTDDGWFRSGDLGYVDEDGYLHVTGRLSTLIVTAGGENIQPDDLEARYAAHAAIREIGVLQRDERLVALIVPAAGSGADAQARIAEAIAEIGRGLPSYQRLDDFAVTAKPLPRTRLGKLRRHQLEQRYDHARAGETRQLAPLDPDEMSAEDRSLLQQPAARAAWEWLAGRYPQQGLSPDTRLQSELGVDSLAWLNLTMELGQRSGVELDDEAIGRIETVRDLLHELIDAAGRDTPLADPLDDPEGAIDAAHRRWLQPRSASLRAAASALYLLDRGLMHALFRLRVHGRRHLPEAGPVVLMCNHLSHLDPFAVGAILPLARLHTLYWGGWTGVAFTNPLTRFGSRLVQIIPINPEQGPRTSLALAAAVLKRGRGLIWFPEGQRSVDGGLQPFRAGIGMLLERYPVPVVPVAIHGSHAAMPPGRRLPRPGTLSLSFGAPLDPADLARQGEGDTAAARIVQALEQRMRELAAQSG